MTDKAKVIKGLEYCIDANGKNCPMACPFFQKCFSTFESTEPFYPIMRAALDLLKEQEALPIVYQTNEYTGFPVARCPSCGEYLVQFHSGVDGKESRFCYYCGQEVKWE